LLRKGVEQRRVATVLHMKGSPVWDITPFGPLNVSRLAQDRYRWRALVNAIINLRVP
jgi:hypothetical protein